MAGRNPIAKWFQEEVLGQEKTSDQEDSVSTYGIGKDGKIKPGTQVFADAYGGGSGGGNVGPMPLSPEFMSVLGPDGKLLPQYKANTNFNPWMKLQTKALDQRTAGLASTAARDAEMAGGNAASLLAASGGLDSGARERVAVSSMLNRNNNLADINRSGNEQKTQVGIAGETMKQDASKFNVGNSLGGVSAQNMFNMDKYSEDMKGYAAGKTGAAISKGK